MRKMIFVVAFAAFGFVVVTTVAPFVVTAPRAFIDNVFAFPLGLAGVSSPAASPLPGHLLTSAWSPLRHVLLPAVLLIGGYFLVRHLRERWPIDLSAALTLMALCMTVIICSATATRLGYLIYPLNFVLWAWVFSPGPVPSVSRTALVELQRPGG